MGGAQSATKHILRDDYKDKQACQLTVGASAAGIVADAAGAEGTQNIVDGLGRFALMRCVGKSWTFIILYHLILICIVMPYLYALMDGLENSQRTVNY